MNVTALIQYLRPLPHNAEVYIRDPDTRWIMRVVNVDFVDDLVILEIEDYSDLHFNP